MKTLMYMAIAFLLWKVSFPLKAQTPNEEISAKLLHEFQVSTERWRQAYNSKDAQNLVPLYAVDADYISSHVAGLEAIGREKLILNFQNGMNMGGHIDSVEILKMTVSCDLATLLCKYTATNNGVTVVGRNLIVMKKVKDEWLISLHMTVV